ncbi:hypothetical protein ACFXJ8_08395, partial [Nonomuraea sp. NPDC059194]|uniref:hypothetical protein n=1 Tax=Nonomuraea sp. NPDC059194 TaxID=3346764 RepID=UPI003686DB63
MATPAPSIAAVSRRPDHMEVFWVDPADRSIRHAYWYDQGDRRWKLEPQSKITGPQVAAPQTSIAALARKPGTMEVFWIGQDGSVQHAFWYEGAGPWQQGDQARIAPAGVAAPQAGIAAVSRRPDHMEVFWVDPADRSIRHAYW